MKHAILGVLLAIGITTTMDATGYTMFSALPLLPLIGIFWAGHWSSVAFSLWHVSAVSLDTGFDLPLRQIPVYLINATVIGAIWGLLRRISASVFACAVSHAVWNGIDYPLFGFGTGVGALGIAQTEVYGPEVGVLGLGLNLAFAVCLWLWITRRQET